MTTSEIPHHRHRYPQGTCRLWPPREKRHRKRLKGHPLSGTKGTWAAAFAPSSWSDPELGSFFAEETECVGHYSFEAKR